MILVFFTNKEMKNMDKNGSKHYMAWAYNKTLKFIANCFFLDSVSSHRGFNENNSRSKFLQSIEAHFTSLFTRYSKACLCDINVYLLNADGGRSLQMPNIDLYIYISVPYMMPSEINL